MVRAFFVCQSSYPLRRSGSWTDGVDRAVGNDGEVYGGCVPKPLVFVRDEDSNELGEGLRVAIRQLICRGLIKDIVDNMIPSQ